MHIPTIIIDRNLHLEPLTQRYDTAMFNLVSQNRHYLRRWQNWPDRIRALGHMQQLILQTQRKAAGGHGFDLIIMYCDKPVGKIGLVFINWELQIAEIGYWISRPFEGFGIVTRSCHAIVDYAISELALKKVQIRCAVGNVRSRAIPQRLGFDDKGKLPYQTSIHGEYHDEILYEITMEKWKNRMIYHITTRAEWSAAQQTDIYEAPSLAEQGFIHLSNNTDQVIRVANAIYKGQQGLVILCVDPTRLRGDLRYEPPDTSVPADHDDGERFPHLYDVIPVDAVVDVIDFPPQKDGTFALVDGLPE